jgi:hypothetical protein
MPRLLAAATLAVTLAVRTASAEPFTFVALGDVPYNVPADYARFERLITEVNKARPAFSIHVGDIKSGGSACSDENFQKIKDYFGTFEQPLVYTPGDNEWTDCHRDAAGGFDPLERLRKLRSMFFVGPQSLGRTTMPIERQADLALAHGQFVENARWTRDGVIFATVHMVGSNNGFERNEAMTGEYFGRNAANVAWIEDTFAKAATTNAPALVFAFQADPLFQVDPKSGLTYANSGFANTLKAFATGAESFKKPVLLIHGDTHIFIVDQPLKAADGKSALENVYRLEVMGADKVQAIRVRVDPSDPAVFGYLPLIVPANLRTAGPG